MSATEVDGRLQERAAGAALGGMSVMSGVRVVHEVWHSQGPYCQSRCLSHILATHLRLSLHLPEGLTLIQSELCNWAIGQLCVRSHSMCYQWLTNTLHFIWEQIENWRGPGSSACQFASIPSRVGQCVFWWDQWPSPLEPGTWRPQQQHQRSRGQCWGSCPRGPPDTERVV